MDNISSAFTKLHMPGMASCWRTLNETHQTDKLSFSDGLELLLQSELDSRRNNRIARLIRSANFKQHACIEELEASDARGIPAGAVNQLATGEYLKAGATIIISGPTGTGKSFLACALGEGACRLGYKVKYYNYMGYQEEGSVYELPWEYECSDDANSVLTKEQYQAIVSIAEWQDVERIFL